MVNELPNQNFQSDLDTYMGDFERYLVQKWECSVNRANSINLLVNNFGGQPATDITLDLLMPTQFATPEEHHKYNRETTPLEQIIYHVEKPLAPRPFIDLGIMNFPINISPVSSSLPPFEDPGPLYKQENDGVHVIFKIKKLIQHSPSEELEPFWIWLGEIEEEETWDIKVKITCAELQQPVNDNIKIKIRKE